MTKLTAVDWGRGIEENQVPAHILIPALPYHRSDRTREPRTDTGTARGGGALMYHSAELSTLPPLQYENITVMKKLLIAVAFPLDKLHCFLCHPVVWTARKKPPETSSSMFHHDGQTLCQLLLNTEQKKKKKI